MLAAVPVSWSLRASSVVCAAVLVVTTGAPAAAQLLDEVAPQPPSAPAAPAVEPRDAAVRVDWQRPRSDGGAPIRGYTITASPGDTRMWVDAGSTAATVRRLRNGTTYRFTVRAHNAAGSGPGSPASRAVTPRRRTALRMRVSRSQVRFGRPVVVRGRLLRAGTSDGLARRPVELLARPKGAERFRVVERRRSQRDGRVEVRVEPRRRTVYRLRHRGTAATRPSISSRDGVSVRPWVRARVSRSVAPVGRTVVVRGGLRPLHPGKRVILQRRRSDGWHRVDSARLTSRSRFRFRVAPQATARTRYRVVRRGDHDHLRAHDRTGRLTVYRVAVERINYNPRGDDARRRNAEYAVVRNTGRVSVPLRGWKIHAGSADRTRRLPAYRLPPRRSVLVHTGRGATTRRHVHLRAERPLWRNHRGDTAVLRDRYGALADRHRYDAPPPLRGLASWYGSGFAGQRTACGGRFDPSRRTLASRELPCGTRVDVVAPGGRSVTAVVTDYGPASWTGRRFDLSRATFRALRPLAEGEFRARVLER